MNLIPAYGRDYKSKKEVESDFYNGKDFIISDISSRWDGKPCSCRDLNNGEYIEIRYGKLTKVTVFRFDRKKIK